MHPLQGLHEILLAQVHGLGISAAQAAEVGISEHIQAVIQVDDHDIAFRREGAALIAGKVMAGTGREASAVEPDEDGTLFPVIDSLGPDIQYEALLLVHRFIDELEGEVVVAGKVAVSQGLPLRGLGAVSATHFHTFKFVRVLRRHEALRLGIRDAAEGIDVPVQETLDAAIDRGDDRRFIGHDGAEDGRIRSPGRVSATGDGCQHDGDNKDKRFCFHVKSVFEKRPQPMSPCKGNNFRSHSGKPFFLNKVKILPDAPFFPSPK